MKKIIYLLMVCIIAQGSAFAKDYIKLQEKELKQAQKYGTTNKVLREDITPVQVDNVVVKDPQILTLGGYEEISTTEYNKKLQKDEAEYKKIYNSMIGEKSDNYNKKAYAEDYYQVYRVAEKMIRANKLDYIDWRIAIVPDSNFNAFTCDTNYIAIHTGALDSVSNNEDALAFLIGHEMGHALLGHGARIYQSGMKLRKAKKYSLLTGDLTAYTVALAKFNKTSRDMEYAADVEGAKLLAKAGYNLNNAREILNMLNTFTTDYGELSSDHPSPEHRYKNFYENKKYFMEQEWAKQGKYNIYNSEVLSVKQSSDRKSLVISRSKNSNSDTFYRPETLEQLYIRMAYKSYVNGEFKQAEGYFQKALSINSNNPILYLYASYVQEVLYKKSGKEKHLNNAKNYINKAKSLSPDNKYILEQVEAL